LGRARGGLVQALHRRARLSLGQAGRPALQRADLRQPLGRRGRRGLHPHSGRAAAGPTATEPTRHNAPPGPPGGAFSRIATGAFGAAQAEARLYAPPHPRLSGFTTFRRSGFADRRAPPHFDPPPCYLASRRESCVALAPAVDCGYVLKSAPGATGGTSLRSCGAPPLQICGFRPKSLISCRSHPASHRSPRGNAPPHLSLGAEQMRCVHLHASSFAYRSPPSAGAFLARAVEGRMSRSAACISRAVASRPTTSMLAA
jgi:hypothetical protein